MSSLVGVEFPLSVSDSESLDSLSDSAGGEAALGRLRPLSTEPRGARSTPSSGSTEGSGGRVGAGVASPEAMARLSEDSERGMSVARSGSGGAENRSENPPPDLGTAGASSESTFAGGSAGVGGTGSGSGLGTFSGWGRGGCGRAGGGLGRGGGPGLAGFAGESEGFGGSSLGLVGSSEGRDGGGGLEGGAAGRGGGGLTGATSRLSVMSFSSSKLS